ncbi:YIP1 family protein [Geobacillus thermocatenulatus]|uniref:YIP1 family protein n=2 Tax=Geobacillus TaxID=129337 RepID=UPI003D1B7E00
MVTEINLNQELRPKKGPTPKILGMFWNPSLQFKRIKENPRILFPLFVVIVLQTGAMTFNAYTIKFDPSQFHGLNEQQLATAKQFAQITMIISGILLPILLILLFSALHILFAKFTSSDVNFKQLFSMNTYIFIIGTAGLILNSLIRFLINGDMTLIVTSLGSIIKTDGFASKLLNAIEVFSIWRVILTYLGLKIVANLSKSFALIVAIIVFLGGILIGAVLG